MGIRIRLSPRARAVSAMLCGLWFVVAVVRVVAWSQGHPGDPVSLGFGLLAGVAGFAGLVASGFAWRHTRREG